MDPQPEKSIEPPKNRAMRRSKGRKFTIADMRMWRAESIKQKLYSPKKV